jgi:hypothetical protein
MGSQMVLYKPSALQRTRKSESTSKTAHENKQVTTTREKTDQNNGKKDTPHQ